MSADMRYAIDNLARSASHAAWDMTVNTALVRKLIAAAELAEAVLDLRAANDADSDAAEWTAARNRRNTAVVNYRKETGR